MARVRVLALTQVEPVGDLIQTLRLRGYVLLDLDLWVIVFPRSLRALQGSLLEHHRRHLALSHSCGHGRVHGGVIRRFRRLVTRLLEDRLGVCREHGVVEATKVSTVLGRLQR